MKTFKRILITALAVVFSFALCLAVAGLYNDNAEKKTVFAYGAQTDYIDNVGISATINDIVAFDVYLRRSNAVMNQVCMINSDHNKYVGYYKVYLDGSGSNTTGAYAFPNGKGGYTVVLDLTKGPKGGSPTEDTVLNCFRKRGDSGDDNNSDFYVENFRIVNNFSAFSISAGLGSTFRHEINTLTNGTDNAVAVVYKMDADDKFVNFGLGNGSNAWFGYYTLYGSVGNTSSYNGVTLRELDTDWVLAIFDLTAMTNKSGSAENWTGNWPADDSTTFFNKVMAQKSNTGAMTGYVFGYYSDLYTVTVTGGTGGNVYLPDENATATVEADTAPSGKGFAGWSNGSSIVSTDEEYSFAVTGDVTLTATYADLYTVTVTGGTIGGETSAEVIDGDSATVVAGDPDTGKYFAYWTDGNGKTVSFAPTYTFTVSEDITLTANYLTRGDGVAFSTGSYSVYTGPNASALEIDFDYLIFDYYLESGSRGIRIVNSSGEFPTTYTTGNSGTGYITYALENGWKRMIFSIKELGYSSYYTAEKTILRLYLPSGSVSGKIDNVKFIKNYTVSVTGGTGSGTYFGGTSGQFGGTSFGGTSATVVATPADGYYFRNWTDDSDDSVVSTSASYTFTVTEDVDLTANTRAYDGTKVAVGEKVNQNLSGTLSDEFTFEYLFEGDTGSAGVCLTNSLTNSIGVNYFTISNGSVGSTLTEGVTITREQLSDGYYKVTVSGDAVATEGMCKLYSNTSNKVANAALWIRNAQFTEKKLVTVVNGTIGGNSSAYVTEGEEATVVANEPASTKYFVGWDNGSGIVSPDASYTFEVEDDITLTATYADKASVSATGAASGTGLYVPGASATLVANAPSSGYYFAYWTDEDGNIVSFAPSYTFTVSEDITLTANYDTRASGVAFTTSSKRYYAASANTYDYVVFDYKLDGEGSRTFRILNSSSNYTGTFTLGTDYSGKVTCYTLESGWVRVFCTISGFDDYSTKYSGEGNVNAVYIPSDGSGETGSITNVRFVKNGTVSVTNGTLQNGETSGTFTGTTSVTVTADDAPLGKVFVCWKDGSGNVMSTEEDYTFQVVGNVSLTAYYANLVTVSASSGTVDGESSKTLADGSTITLVANAPATGYYFLNWTNTAGTEIATTSTAEVTVSGSTTYTANYLAYSGTKYNSGVSADIYAPKGEKAYDRVTFDYKLAADDKTAGFCLSQSGSKFFGYFYVNNSGTTSSYDGVSTERLSDGYIRISLDLDDLTITAGDLDDDSVISYIHLSGGKLGADVYIKNINFLIANEPFSMYAGASVRLTDPYGIRFRALIPFDKYDEDATYGMIILPYDYITDNEIDLSGDVLAQLNAKSVKYRNFTCTPIEMDTTDYYIQGSLTNILSKNLNREFIGIGYYVKDEVYTYVQNATSCRRTIVGVSESAIKTYDLFNGYTAKKQEFLLKTSGSDGAAAVGAFTANAFDSIENFKKNDSVSTSSTLTLTAGKGESEFGQIVLTATSTVANKAYIIIPNDLTHDDGSTVLSKSNFELFNAYYTNVDSNWIYLGSYDYATTLTTGYYVNALVPFYAASTSGEAYFDRSHGDNQTIFIRFDIPESQKAGTYTGTFRIYVLGVGYRDVSVSFTVADFTLPEVNNYKSKYGISSQAIALVYDTDSAKTTDEYAELYDFLLDYNLNGGLIPAQSLYFGAATIDSYIASLVEYYNNPKVAAIQIDFNYGPAYYEYKKTAYSDTQEYDDINVIYEYDWVMSEHATCYGTRSTLKAIAEYCVENDINLFEKLYYRYNDEPADAASCISTILSYNAVKNGVDYALEQVDFTGHEDIEASLRYLPYIVTVYPSEQVKDDYGATVTALVSGNKLVDSVSSQTAYYPANEFNSQQAITINYKFITDFVPTYDKVIGHNKDSTANTIRTDSDPNTHLWWYPMIMTFNPYPNYVINADQVINRSKAWATYYYGIEGELYYCTNAWWEFHFTDSPANENYVSTILGEEAIWNGDAVYFGGYEDGTLVYPNATRYAGDFKYCPTYRLVATREGIDDYNYICYAQSLIDGLSSGDYKTSKQSALNSYVASMVTPAATDAIINSSASTLRTARNNLIALIEELEGYV